MIIYHNPRCSKSRQALQLLEEHGAEPEVIKYLEEVPTKEQLREVIDLLGIEPSELVRTTEKIYKEKFRGRELSPEEWIEAMVSHPKLIQRPIVISGNRAVVGRPPEKVKELL
ncbi:MAG: arsenate reductase (glutaredoxin) [Balneolaceae bacterium]|nr:arsenate reductase (glutaredoxin) [Balneolaceae bacterium]